MATSTTGRRASQLNFTPTPGGPSLETVLVQIKKDFDTAATNKGSAGLLSITRSAKPIKRLHQHAADLLVQAGIPAAQIDLERSIATLFGDKVQDVVAIPRHRSKPTGSSTLSIAIAGQMYGIQKNKDNAFSKARSELLNLHEKHNDIVLGHVQVLAIKGWDSDTLRQQNTKRPNPKRPNPKRKHTPVYTKLSPGTLAEMIDRFRKITGRRPGDSDGFAERIALLLVDFSQNPPVVYTDVDSLERDGYLTEGSGLSLDHLTLVDFATDLITIHRDRFTGANRL